MPFTVTINHVIMSDYFTMASVSAKHGKKTIYAEGMSRRSECDKKDDEEGAGRALVRALKSLEHKLIHGRQSRSLFEG